ncbi:lycopene cyclase domain-containing protein [Demequina zhanjiangensis]|uniref:Lycopene cyclase domain-containing protein n=1 Tax=Demequina zhanjiangensis TaxID=3051659 RepID=A0ABT8FZT3_9MICO|nr:lycopene cyclase domain-containing protein [Demequina sp. SYSU T00b26]MDN4472401.1 lycopene cyclase domain-containing protein [Demequina sp. SYSU T00b26]
MSNYITLSGLMLVLILLFTFRPLRRLPARPLLLTGAVLLALTFVFDNLIVGAGIVGYDDSLTLGIRVPIAPIEDFAYAIGAVLLIPALWQWNSRLAPRDHHTAATDPAAPDPEAERP